MTGCTGPQNLVLGQEAERTAAAASTSTATERAGFSFTRLKEVSLKVSFFSSDFAPECNAQLIFSEMDWSLEIEAGETPSVKRSGRLSKERHSAMGESLQKLLVKSAPSPARPVPSDQGILGYSVEVNGTMILNFVDIPSTKEVEEKREIVATIISYLPPEEIQGLESFEKCSQGPLEAEAFLRFEEILMRAKHKARQQKG